MEIEIEEGELMAKMNKTKKQQKSGAKQPLSRKKKILIVLGVVLVLTGLGIGAYFLWFYNLEVGEEVRVDERGEPVKYYSKLSGEEIASEAENAKPLYCMQIPNGLDVGQPRVHVGLNEAKVVFEAIAEAGITRFAAIFQNPQSSMIGPIRSIRSYYLDWDTPFDCTVVHAGGSDEALAALRAGGYRDLTENYSYMWRDYSGYVAPNNLFTSAVDLRQFNADRGYETSDFTAWPRLTPEEAAQEVARLDAQSAEGETAEGADEEVAEPAPVAVNSVVVRFGYNAYFNPVYTYDKANNRYLRGYESGETHQAYACPADANQPSPASTCTLAQVSPRVVVVMRVRQWTDTDGYHQVLDTQNSGAATIFQNGTVVEGTWRKTAAGSQIEFLDKAGQMVKLAPGQLWIEAIPTSVGSLEY